MILFMNIFIRCRHFAMFTPPCFGIRRYADITNITPHITCLTWLYAATSASRLTLRRHYYETWMADTFDAMPPYVEPAASR